MLNMPMDLRLRDVGMQDEVAGAGLASSSKLHGRESGMQDALSGELTREVAGSGVVDQPV